MGCATSAELRAVEHSNEIDKRISEDKNNTRTEFKLLLLGTEESGKSAIAKQLTSIHNGSSTEHSEIYRRVVYSNTIQSMLSMIRAMEALGVAFGDNDRESDKAMVNYLVREMLDSEPFTPEVHRGLKRLWADSGIQEVFMRSNEYHLNDSAQYFFESLDRLAEVDYKPNEQDILQTRVKATEIVETHLEIRLLYYRLFDVGSLKAERKRWIHYFEDVPAIIFCAALSEYDQMLLEDNVTNRLHESLELFGSICNNKWFTKTIIFLFLSKKDLFQAKIERSPLTVCFPEYTGPNEFLPASQYIQGKFEAMNKRPNKQIYSHMICETDTDNIRIVFDLVTDMVRFSRSTLRYYSELY